MKSYVIFLLVIALIVPGCFIKKMKERREIERQLGDFELRLESIDERMDEFYADYGPLGTRYEEYMTLSDDFESLGLELDRYCVTIFGDMLAKDRAVSEKQEDEYMDLLKERIRLIRKEGNLIEALMRRIIREGSWEDYPM
ncbi:MAG: hypothetical protein LHW45_06585 [Candidatus Cloacimonetes bacterium]|nr:hypothetical protein [Candidatus Cloacimonadota bacterium]MDY0367277.1 hypothetical protein [Candidatus Syntrophosphaera sp.]